MPNTRARWAQHAGEFHKQELFVYLKQKWADLFGADFEVLLYDLTSTYFEGEMEH